MDERLIKNSVGKPVPDWDMAHRLSIRQAMGPSEQDFGSVFCVNSTFMDVTEPNFLERHWLMFAGLIALGGVAIGPYVYWLTEVRYPYAGGWVGDFFCLCISLFFLYWVVRVLSGYVLGLKYRPIRFHRREKKIYAMRARRSVGRGEGDTVWEAPWNEKAIYCLHREATQFGTVFHIRHYEIDDVGNVVRVFSIGRGWTGKSMVAKALAQWNYFCKYMNDGPDGLPKPMLFQSAKETLHEAYLLSMYSFGLGTPAFLRLFVMPLVLLFTGLRYAANATCRAPIWPPRIEKLCAISSGDRFQEPRGSTPIGWVQTISTQARGDYPEGEELAVEDWKGEKDGLKSAIAWLENPSLGAAEPIGRSAR